MFDQLVLRLTVCWLKVYEAPPSIQDLRTFGQQLQAELHEVGHIGADLSFCRAIPPSAAHSA